MERKNKKGIAQRFLPFAGTIATILMVAFIPRRTYFWVAIAFGGVLLLCHLISKFSKKELPALRHVVSLLFTATLFVVLWNGVGYTFVSGSTLPFWLPALVIALLAGAFRLWKKFRIGEKGWEEIFVAVFVAGFVFVFAAVFMNYANYALDTVTPVREEGVIWDKRASTSRKSRDSYRFLIKVDGEQFFLEVPRATYQRFDVGDTYSFSRYEGALGEPFYIAE